MKLLSGADLAGFIQARQAKQVRGLIQAHGVRPRLAIVQTNHIPVIDTYVALKKDYGKDILIDVEAAVVTQAEALAAIKKFNSDPLVHGVIVQLPLADPEQTDALVAAILPQKDIDALSEHSPFAPATAQAINWLLTGYNIELAGKRLVIVGNGRLVGQPLYRLWQAAGYDVTVLDKQTKDVTAELKTADIIVTATGVPGVLKSDMIPIGAVVVDAGVASEAGKTLGDLAPEIYERHDLTLTPKIGGVGPLTVAALFDNVIRAATG